MLATHATDTFTSRLAQRKAFTQASFLVEHHCAMGNDRVSNLIYHRPSFVHSSGISFSSLREFWHWPCLLRRFVRGFGSSSLHTGGACSSGFFVSWVPRRSARVSTIDPLFLAYDILHQRPDQVQSSRGHLRKVLQSRLLVHLHFLLHGMCPASVRATFKSIASF